MNTLQIEADTLDAVDNLADTMAQDLETLLSAVKGRASLMMNSISESDPLYFHFKELMEGIEKGTQITSLLLDFAKVDEFYKPTANQS